MYRISSKYGITWQRMVVSSSNLVEIIIVGAKHDTLPSLVS